MSTITYNSSANQFAQTRKMFSEYTGVSGPISYEEWAKQSEDMKAAILFVNFYEQITFAWYKTINEHVYEEQGVDEAVSICSKLCGASFKRIQANTKTESSINADTFQARYIYRVMKNAFDCLAYAKNGTKLEYRPDDKYNPNSKRNVQSQYSVDSSGTEFDILSTIDGSEDPLEVLEKEKLRAIIATEEENEETQYIIDRLMRYDERIREAKDLTALEKVKEARAKYVERNLEAISALQEKLIEFCPA